MAESISTQPAGSRRFRPKGDARPRAAGLAEPGIQDRGQGQRFRPKHVWSRKESKYRIRAAVLLGVNVLLFACVGCFTFWLRSGEVFAPGTASYADEIMRAFRFGERSAVSLVTFLIEPINVQDVPFQIPIVGLLMAALISIPILVAILYRFWASLPFILVVGFLAVMPWLAITLLFSCILATARPLRTRFRFMSAMLGLLPTVVYLVLAWRGGSEILAGTIDPVDRIKFVAPWVLAIVAATLVFAIVLFIAKIVDYRPGAIAPLLAIMFGLPVVLFEVYVGRDDLHFRLLAALEKSSFSDVDASLDLRQAARRRWERQPMPRRAWDATLEIEEIKWQFYLASDVGPVRSEMSRHQARIAARCDWFCKQFPMSRYAPVAMFIKARSLDQRVDPWEFRQTKWIRFYDDFPSPSSEETWRLIAEREGDSLMGAHARLRLAQLNARSGEILRALDGVRQVLGVVQAVEAAKLAGNHQRSSSAPNVLASNAPESGLTMSVERLHLLARGLHDLLESNRDPIYGYDPISGASRKRAAVWFGLLDLDPRHENYADNLRLLRKAYPDCQILDNIDLELAKAASTCEDRITKLEACLASFPGRDAAPEALFRLAAAYKKSGLIGRGAETIARLRSTFADSIWSRQAARLVVSAPLARATFVP